MLKALELAGFKSFADKTRFEFPDGITVVVGPNGSGKSNVVDAIKWVLGEQSAKSLRGQDMADVIFKGGGASGRKPMNAAEATIVFENGDRRLPIDAPEVHVTRRVYRSGEGEYLINRQPCRLKDIKDLFRGTGVGVDAYSIIEQGKVDRLLQASPKDRRAMFEEAAGISRFKAKKIEAQRRLERVDQNLLRLNDIVEEVDARLRTVRAQAAKAKRYREYSDRLQQLRTQVGLTDWRKLTEKLQSIERELDRLRDESAEIASHTELQEARTFETETEVGVATELIREGEARVARLREQIITLESGADQQRSRGVDLDEEASRCRQNLAVLTNKAGDLQLRLRELRAILEKAEEEHRAVVAQVAHHESQLNSLAAELERMRGETESRRNLYVARMRAAAALSNEVSVHRSQLASLSESVARFRQRLEELEQTAAGHASERRRLLHAGLQLEDQQRQKAEQLELATRELAENRRVLARRQQEVVELLGRLSGAQERSSLLGELEAKRDGVGAGVKEVLQLAKDEPDGPFGEVRGLVADMLQASLELAPLIDVALGAVAQHVLLDGHRLVERIASGAFRPSSRVGFIRLVAAAPTLAPVSRDNDPSPGDAIELQPGVIGRADRLVEAPVEYQPLIHRLLGATWFVEDLTTALHLQSRAARPGRFVTSAGQLLEADGTVVAGPRQTADGLVSRRSELRDLKQRVSVLEWQIDEGQRELLRLQENIDAQDRDVRQLTDDQKELAKTLHEQRARLVALDRLQQETEQQRLAVDDELVAAIGQQDSVNRQLDDATQSLDATEAEITSLESNLRLHDRQVESLDAQRQASIRQTTAAKVELAKSEQRLEGMRSQVAQFEHDQRERSKAVAEARAQLAQCIERRTACDRAILRATSELAELYLRKETQAGETLATTRRREALLARRAALAEELQAVRRKVRALEEEQHARELAANEVRHERAALVERLKEDYAIDIAAYEAPPTGDELQQREQVEEEIATLRKKINGLGAVNMDALVEADAMEARFASISNQFQDLKQAKEALERIIQKINADSRKLFLDTLEAIRINFQTLYRRAFGGGRADIVLEAGADVLECGVDILATPPGKPSFSNSLLSGGEKALTAVALLLAIFQFRPSPFCVLDEVDAPFDEANVGRFVSVLKDFLSFTKFIIVTHSKKTMTAATTLYGVTMQESGVSKRVSVQFDDVTEDGHIRKEAVERESSSSREDRREAA